MFILHVIDNLHAGGAEKVLVNMCNWLHSRGIRVEVVLIIGAGKDLLSQLNPEIITHILDRKYRLDMRTCIQLARLLRQPDIVHIHMRQNYRYIALIAKLFHIKTPLIFHDHYGSINQDQSIPLGFKTIVRPQWYVGVSNTLVSWAQFQLGLSQRKIFLLENVAEAKKKKEKNFEKKDLVLVSNIKPQKNQMFIFELLQKSTLNLDIYGARQDEKYARLLDEQINQNNFYNRIRIFNHVNDVRNHLDDYRLGLHTSLSETGPLAIIEYLAEGLPFLAYRTGEAAEKISREFPEYFMDNFDSEAWKERIQMLMNTPPDKEKMALTFEMYFSKQAYIEKCLKIYGHILAS